MEPRSIERGEARAAVRIAAGLQASMEPRSIERGEPNNRVASSRR